MVDLGTVGILAQASTGAFVLLAGLAALASVSPRRHTVSFSLFLILWGSFLLAGNLAHLRLQAGDLVHAHDLLMIQAVVQGLAYLPLAVFTVSYPPSRQIDLDRWPVMAGLLAPAIALLAVALIDPALLHRGFAIVGGESVGQWGPASAGVFTLFILTIYAVTIRLTRVHERSTSRLERRQALLVLLGFTLFVGFESAQNGLMYSGFLAGGLEGIDVVTATITAMAIAGIGVVIWVANSLLRGPNQARGIHRRLATACIAGSIGVGLVSGASFLWPAIPALPAESIWRLGTVALVMSAVTRFEGERPGRLLPTLAGMLGWFAVGAAGLLTIHLGLLALSGSVLVAFVGLIALLVASTAYIAWRRPGTFAEMMRYLRRRRSTVGRQRRNLELYEAAVLSQREEGMLQELRQRMSISPAEHEIIRRLAGTSPTTRSRARARASGAPNPSADEASEPEPVGPGRVLEGRYELEEVLGEGRSARVFRAHDRKRDQDVAIKILDAQATASDQDLRRFLYESRTCLRLDHPNLLDAYGMGYDQGRPFLVFELVEGGTLADSIPEDGLPAQEACGVVTDLLAGLQHLHAEGLVHRDLKPDNILLTEDGTAKIGDLGLAEAWDAHRTQQLGPEGPNLRAGTPAYMSPGALRGRPPSPRCDVYAAGAIFVEAMTGRHYLGLEGAPYGTVKRAVIQAPPRLDGIDARLAAICRQALAKDPADRFPSAAEMREAILDVVGPQAGKTYEMLLSKVRETTERVRSTGSGDREPVAGEGA